MILPDPALPAPQTARREKAPDTRQAVPHAALARLALLRDQARHDLDLLCFLARVPRACLVLLAAGASALIWAKASSGPAALEREFLWVLSVLTGIVAMTGLHVMSYARGSAPMPPHQAVLALRRMLFCTGAAWGAGAWLIMPIQPSPVLAVGFATLPCLGLCLLLGDQKGITAFTAPVLLATASAACLQPWPSGLWVAAIILATGLAIFCFPMLQREMRRDAVPTVSLNTPPI